MTPDVRAADLPEGSIVANDRNVWIKQAQSGAFLYPWGTSAARFNVTDSEVDRVLAAGAAVLRTGYGEKQP